MDFALNEHQQDVQRRAREFAASSVAPGGGGARSEGTIPADIIAGVAELGLLGCEHDFVAYVAGLVEISESVGVARRRHRRPQLARLLSHFALRQRARRRRRTSRCSPSSKQLGCYAFAEPLAGSDAGAIRTTAVRRRRRISC